MLHDSNDDNLDYFLRYVNEAWLTLENASKKEIKFCYQIEG